MTRIPLPYSAPDIASVAKSLREQLAAHGAVPSHVEMLNMLARAGGHRNFQDLKASSEAAAVDPPAVSSPATELDLRKARRAAGYFDGEGRLKSWPAKTNLQQLCLWILWSRLPAGTGFTEQEISELIDAWHLFGDRALIRREMVDHRLVKRTADGRDYRRIEQKPPVELRVMLEMIEHRG